MREVLASMSTDLVRLLQDDTSIAQGLELHDSRGFQKAPYPLDLFSPVAVKYRQDPQNFQAELILINRSMPNKVYKHADAHAYCTILGAREGVEDPKDAFAFRANRWDKVKVGDIVNIPPEAAHGFEVSPGGILYFLSLQTPPIQKIVDSYNTSGVMVPRFPFI